MYIIKLPCNFTYLKSDKLKQLIPQIFSASWANILSDNPIHKSHNSDRFYTLTHRFTTSGCNKTQY